MWTSRHRSVTAVTALIGSLTILAVAAATVPAASPATGTYQCRGSAAYGVWSPVSAGPNSYIIGNCAPGTQILRTWISNDQNGPYSGGYVGGSFNGCGAVQDINRGPRLNAAKTSFCTDSSRRNSAEFLSYVDCRSSDPACRAWDPDLAGANDTQVLKPCQAYANVRPFGAQTQATDPVQVITPANRAVGQVRWRYLTRDRRFLMVHDRQGRASGGAVWVFVAIGCVSTPHAVTP